MKKKNEEIFLSADICDLTGFRHLHILYLVCVRDSMQTVFDMYIYIYIYIAFNGDIHST